MSRHEPDMSRTCVADPQTRARAAGFQVQLSLRACARWDAGEITQFPSPSTELWGDCRIQHNQRTRACGTVTVRPTEPPRTSGNLRGLKARRDAD
eukprot:3927495-Rhodomonas_salina.2